MIKFASKELPGMIVGIGSVADSAAASQYMLLGANFVVTPVLREDIAIVCNRRKVLWVPGCGSLSEITKAEEMGCEFVKLFLVIYMAQILLNPSKPHSHGALSCRLEEFQLSSPIFWDGLRLVPIVSD